MSPTHVEPQVQSPPVDSLQTIQAGVSDDQRAKNRAALDHLDARLAAVARMTSAEVANAEREWNAFKQAINENRLSSRPRYVD